MNLIIGLGNPGEEYQKTKHNVGFKTVDFLAKKHKLDWENKAKKSLSEVSSGKIDSKKVFLAKPLTFMNNSGKAAAILVKEWKIAAKNIIVIHDDSDLPLGKIKISYNKNSGGHRGVESIIKALKTKEFWRLRIGIQPSAGKKHIPAEKLVLQKFKPEEEKIIVKTVKKACEALETAINESPDKAMSIYNE